MYVNHTISSWPVTGYDGIPVHQGGQITTAVVEAGAPIRFMRHTYRCTGPAERADRRRYCNLRMFGCIRVL